MLAKLKELAEDVDDASTGDGAAKGSKTGEGEDDDLADDDFEEDEDEEDDDDYNAEKYFNNGDDDDYGDEEDPNEEAAFLVENLYRFTIFLDILQSRICTISIFLYGLDRR